MKRFPGKAAFSLVEVAFAVGVASFCLITIIALIPAGITANQSSVEQTEATGLMAGVVADLRATPQPTSESQSGTFQSPRYQIPIPRGWATASTTVNLFLTQDGSLSGTLNANALPASNPRYRVMLNFYPPGAVPTLAATSTAATRARVLITWPALSDPSVSSVPAKFTGSVETVVELNRNWLDHN